MLLEIKDLKVEYGKAKAIDGVSLNINEGEIVCIVGANGAGKTTIIRTISGLKKPASGEIWYMGKRIDGMPAHEVVKMGITQIPSGRMIFAPMTVLDNLKIGSFLRKDRENINRDLNDMFKHFPILKERETQKGGRLSGGEQQMLAVARALMAAPKLLLMDEPSMGLSPLLVAEVASIIRDINKEGISILLVEQNCRMALRLANRAYVLELGKIALEGDAKELANDERVKEHYLGGARV
jgi:branched-chain amino acid transport system ATP-binding protein